MVAAWFAVNLAAFSVTVGRLPGVSLTSPDGG
jgi:hypothetical protein